MGDLIVLMARLVAAFEEQNRLTASWMETQTRWHEEDVERLEGSRKYADAEAAMRAYLYHAMNASVDGKKD